jgi:hypothetical protein
MGDLPAVPAGDAFCRRVAGGWPAAAAGKASDRHFLVSLWSGLAKARSLLW